MIVYQFSRSKVERGDFSHFLGLYSLDKLPTGRRLRQMMNTLMFCIDGYDNDPREIYEIPEVRKFYRAFQKVWPYSLYFANIDTDCLRPIVFCCLDKLTSGRQAGNPTVLVHPDKAELMKFFLKNFGPMNLLCQRAQMFESRIFDRSQALFEYFGLPYEAGPPQPGL